MSTYKVGSEMSVQKGIGKGRSKVEIQNGLLSNITHILHGEKSQEKGKDHSCEVNEYQSEYQRQENAIWICGYTVAGNIKTRQNASSELHTLKLYCKKTLLWWTMISVGKATDVQGQ